MLYCAPPALGHELPEGVVRSVVLPAGAQDRAQHSFAERRKDLQPCVSPPPINAGVQVPGHYCLLCAAFTVMFLFVDEASEDPGGGGLSKDRTQDRTWHRPLMPSQVVPFCEL